MNKFLEYLNNNFYDVVLGFLFLINLFGFLAPIFAWLGWTVPADAIYQFYSFLCHQFSWRSIHIHDYQMAWCTRDVFIWGAMFFVALVVRFRDVKPLPIYWLIPFVIPIALDGGIQTIETVFNITDPLYVSTNFMRMLTGSIFGTGLGLWMMPTLKEVVDEQNEKPVSKNRINPFIIVVISLALAVLSYLALVQVWDLTSEQHPPRNFLDLEVRSPADPRDWFVRRGNAV